MNRNSRSNPPIIPTSYSTSTNTPSPNRPSPSCSPHILRNNGNNGNQGSNINNQSYNVMHEFVNNSDVIHNRRDKPEPPPPTILSPHITALRKLHTNNLNDNKSNRELSPSPRDINCNINRLPMQIMQHQDIKYQHLQHPPQPDLSEYGILQ